MIAITAITTNGIQDSAVWLHGGFSSVMTCSSGVEALESRPIPPQTPLPHR